MQVFWILFKKEFSGCFKNGIAYVVVLIYLLASIGIAFYHGSYLAMHDAALYSLFMWQPLILMIIIPALTMRVWTEEYKSGTDEFLFTQPLTDRIPVLAKFSAVFSLLTMMSIFLLPFVFSSAMWLHLDVGNLICNFIGLELVMFLFSALGCLMSCLSRQMIIAYLLSAMLIALLIWLPSGHFYDIYNNFLFGEIGIFDVLYFVLLGCGLLILNILAVTLRRAVIHYRTLKFIVFGGLLSAGLIFCLLTINNLSHHKVDFTSAKIYTPKPQTEAIIENLNQPITLEIYVAQDYLSANPINQHFFEQILRFTKKYETISKGLIKVETLPVKAYSALEENILQRGLYFEENERGSRDYFGAFVKLGDGTETVIKHFIPQRYAYTEKDIDTALLKLTQPSLQKKIGVYIGQKKLQPLEGILLNLENDYDTIRITDNLPYISSKLDLLILINPKKLPELFLYALDQYIINGGKVMIFFDLYTNQQEDDVNKQSLNIIPFLADWGIDLTDYISNEGEIDNLFDVGKMLNIFTASIINVKNKALEVQPVIMAPDGMVGLILNGKFKSHYQENPFAENNPSLRSLPWTEENQATQITIIGDVDLLNDSYWSDSYSNDKSPYNLIPLAANGDLVRGLVDYMVGNNIYRTLPINAQNSNEQNILTQLYVASYRSNARKLDEYDTQIGQLKAEIVEKSKGNEKVLKQMLKTSSTGRQLAQTEQKFEQLQYKVKQGQTQKIYEIEIMQIILIPLELMLLLWLFLKSLEERQKRKIWEKFDD